MNFWGTLARRAVALAGHDRHNQGEPGRAFVLKAGGMAASTAITGEDCQYGA